MRKTVTITTAAVFLGLSGFAIAQDQDPVKARQDTMKTIGAQMKVLSDMAKGTTAFDADAANAALGLMERMLDLAPPGLDEAVCLANQDEDAPGLTLWPEFLCFSPFGAYLLESSGVSLEEAQQRISAQALLIFEAQQDQRRSSG